MNTITLNMIDSIESTKLKFNTKQHGKIITH
jgi:hypothetical protein